MQIKIFTLPVYSPAQSEGELNKFLRSHRVLQTERHFCADNGGYWTILVEYLDGDPVAEAPSFSRICNPAAWSIRIFNPIVSLYRIANAYTPCGRIANSPELSNWCERLTVVIAMAKNQEKVHKTLKAI